MPESGLHAADTHHARGTHGDSVMKKDPIVGEVRRARQAYAARFNYDPAKIIDDLRRNPPINAPTVRLPSKPAKRIRTAS